MYAFLLRLFSFFICLALFLPLLAKSAEAKNANTLNPSLSAKQILLVDDETGTILLAKDADGSFNPASMIKLLVAEIIFEALDQGEIDEETLFKISETTWRKGGAPSRTTTMFASLGSLIKVGDLLQGLTVVQGNDAALALAEGLSGNTQAFIQRMNKRAQDLNLTDTQIFSITGLPTKSDDNFVSNNRTTARDLVTLARYIEKNHPHYFSLYAGEAFEWNKIFQRNRNPLRKVEFERNIEVDGFVTGEVKGEGFGIVATAKSKDRRLFLVLNGVQSAQMRDSQAKKLIEWGINEFETKLLFAAQENVAQVKVYGGVEEKVFLKTLDPIGILLPKKSPFPLKLRVIYDGPLVAPVKEGAPSGHLIVTSDGTTLLKRPLLTAANVAEAGLTKKALAAFLELGFGWIRKYL